MAASRYLLALGRDELAPASLSRVNQRFGTPHVAILITAAFIFCSLFLKLKVLVEAASLVLILGFMLSNICVIVLRESRVQNYRPAFRAPLYPFMQIIGTLACLLLVLEMGIMAFSIFAILACIGFSAYWFYGRRNASKESALTHLIGRLTAKEILTGNLEEELKSIIRERDDIQLDRFDHLIAEAPVLDLTEPLTRDELFEQIGRAAAEHVDLDPGEITEKLIEREQMSGTALSADIAVPHLILPGAEKFELVLVRHKEGVAFSDEAPNVKAVFVLMGTVDERNFHLRALAGIAQIAQGADFIDRWLAAKNATALRDLLLLSRRQRG
jgi:mannitol/fructose-specific phosphotransferase system IIA component (Ntr-type)